MRMILKNLFLSLFISTFVLVTNAQAQLDPGTAGLSATWKVEEGVKAFEDMEKISIVMDGSWTVRVYFQDGDDLFLVRVIHEGNEMVRAFKKGIKLKKLLTYGWKVEEGESFSLAEIIVLSKSRRDDPIGNLVHEGLVVSIVAEDGFGY